MAKESIYLIITDEADPSVGLFSSTWEIECPFPQEEDTETKEWFREFMVSTYKEFCEGNCVALFDYESNFPDEELTL